MSLTSDHVETDDMRTRIVVTAEKLFRELGYQKTTVVDIAKVLRMSPANVYRFFDSKKSIISAVAQRLMGEVEAVAATLVQEKSPAAQRLRVLLSTIHLMNAERYVGDAKLHEMVAVAMEQSWDVCLAHMEQITMGIGKVIADGVAAGEFDAPDVGLSAHCACTAMMRFFHPQMIAQCAEKPGPTLDQMIDFVLAGLSPRR
jgi:AcrR family transcriptional regulator